MTATTAGSGQIDAGRLLKQSGLAVLFLIVVLSLRHDLGVTGIYFRSQDAVIGGVLIGVSLLGLIWRPKLSLPTRFPGGRTVLGVAVLLTLLLWAGTYAVMLDYPLTRDEHMVIFDAAIFRALSLAAPLPTEWAGYGRALVPDFLLDAPGNAILVSGYMPGNAAMRAAFGMIADPALMNPLLTGAGLVALYHAARRLFPDDPGAVWVSLGAYILSAQVLVTAMTAYAMTGHLALNMIWLALFLCGGKWHHAGAMAIGAWAIGLHQVIFHPLFAGPLILTLIHQRRWLLFAVYSFVYVSALLFWVSYQGLVADAAGIPAAAGAAAGAAGFLAERVLPLLMSASASAVPLMMYNLLRFLAFAPLFVLPLLIVAKRPVADNDGIALPLAAGIALTLAAMAILLPYQGHGWGYRYLHAVLPNVVLLCGYGYRSWAAEDRRTADRVVMLGAAVTALVAVPYLLVTSHLFVKPHAHLAALVARQKTDFVVVEVQPMPRTVDNVRNDPWLKARPLVFSSAHTEPRQVEELCRRGTVTVISEPEFRQVGFNSDQGEAVPQRNAGIEEIRRRTCFRRPV